MLSPCGKYKSQIRRWWRKRPTQTEDALWVSAVLLALAGADIHTRLPERGFDIWRIKFNAKIALQ